MKQFGIDKKKISKTLRCALAIALTASVLTSVCACDKSATESSMEASVPDSTTIETTAETTVVTNPTNETQETIVYIYGGRYYLAGNPAIEGKSGLTSMTLSEAQSAGFTNGASMTQDEKTAYDYNLAWNMVAEGKSDDEIVEALINTGYSNEYSAQFMVNWVREDWDMGIRAYEEPQNTPTIPSSNEDNSGSSNSGSGNSGSGSSGNTTEPTGSTYVPTGVTPIPSEPTSTTQSTQPTTAPTSAPTEPTSAPTEPTSAPTQPTSAPTEPTSAPTETTPAPTETTPAPTEAKYITHYELTGTCIDEQTGADADTFNCTGSSYQNCIDQWDEYCANHGYLPAGYGCVAVWSDGSRTYA